MTQEQLQVVVEAGRPARQVTGPVDVDDVSPAGGTTDLLAHLQTTLDVNQLVRIFDASVQPVVPHASLSYGNPVQDLQLEIGTAQQHSCTYRLTLRDEDLGNLVVTRATPFVREEVMLFENMLITLAFPLRNALMYQRALQSALKDPLTGLYNRSAMDSALHREVLLARRNGVPLSLVILDIDHFKSINDSHGHTTGDAVIKTLSARLADCTRKSDILARFGGEEFSVLMNNTDQFGARLLAERICQAVRAAPCRVPGCDIPFTVSAGVATLRVHESDRLFFERADAALYEAKRSGRDRVCLAQ